MDRKSLLQRLRKTRSSGKTMIIERWLEISESMQAGFSKKHIFEELVKDGLDISYAQFTRFSKELLEQQKGLQNIESQTNPPVTVGKVTAQKRSEPSKKVPVQRADGTEKTGDESGAERFKFDPKPNEKDLF